MSPEPSSSARTQGTTTRPPGLSDFKAFSDLWSSGGFTKASKFLLQSKLYPQELKEFQEVLVDESDKLEDTLGHTGQVIFDDDTTQDRRARIYLASVASKAVYNMHGGSSSPDNITKQAMSIMESRYSLMKRDYLNIPFLSEKPKDWMLCTPNDDTRDRFYIFAVKGSAGADDWLDNLNGGDDPKVQQGLLKEGKEMYDDAAVTLRDLLKDEKRVLFTGHSSGGAVAAYVYKELYSEAVKDQASWKMDCVVFGCAAASNEQVTYPVPGMPGENGIQTRGEQNKDTDTVNNNTNIRIAFVNRYDPVPRATTAYVYWFLNKWNKYHESPNKDRVTATDLPTDSLVPFGQIVTLFNKGEGTTSITNARWLTREEFQGVVYLDPTRHPMTVYLGNVFRLLKQSGYEGIDNEMWNIVNSAG